MKGFAFPRKNAGEAESLAASLEANNRELAAWLNSATVRFESDGASVVLPGDLEVNGDITEGGTAVSLSGHTHTYTQPAVIGVHAYATGTTTVNNSTETVIAFNNERFDSSSFHDNTTLNSRLTVPSGLAGYYAIGAKFSMAANASGVRAGFIRLDGSTKIAESNRNAPSAYGALWEVHTVRYVSAGSYVEAGIWQDSGSNLDTLAGEAYTQFWMVRLAV